MKYFKEILISVLCGLVFILLLFIFNINLSMALPLTFFTYVALILMFSPRKRKDVKIYNGFDQETFDRTIKEDRIKIKEVYQHADLLEGEIRDKTIKICEISEQILENVMNHPKSMKVTKKVFTYYLETTHRVLNIYSELSEQELKSSEVKAKLKKVEDTLDMIITTFEKYLQKSVEDEIFDLDTEIKLLEQTMKMEE